MQAKFVPGLELSRLFYEQAVRPILLDVFPQLPHAAARIGSGSEVLGFDTERSADHEWGPRLELFVPEQELPTVDDAIRAALAQRLPKEFMGWPTHFEPEDAAIRRMTYTSGPVRHRVGVTAISAWCDDRLGFDPRCGVTTFDWLSTPGQRLAETVYGKVYYDGLGELELLRQELRWYPDDVWRFVLASQWQRISQEEAFPGRCAEVGDEAGSRVVTARLVRDLMRLWLLMGRRYVPYSKWLGSAFRQLPRAAELEPALNDALAATTWCDREHHLRVSYERAAEDHNALGLTSPLEVSTRTYFDRPYQVIAGGRFALALRERIVDPHIRQLPLVGAVDQFVDSTDVLTDPRQWRAASAALLDDRRPLPK